MGVNITFYVPVVDVDAALASLGRQLGFRTKAIRQLEDPDPPAIGSPSELVRRHLVKAFVSAKSLHRGPAPLRFVTYWTFDRWPLDAAERRASMVVVARVEQICRVVGASEFVCLPDAATLDALSLAEIRGRTHPLGTTDADLIFREY